MSRPHPALLDLVAGRPLRGGPDLVTSAAEHRLSGQLLAAVGDGRALVGEQDQHLLVATDLANRSHHERLWTAQAELLDRLDPTGIEVAALKGVTNEARWYDLPAQRPCRDLDLLVAPHATDRLGELLAVLAPSYPLAAEAVALARRGQLQHVHFEHDGVTVDLHLDPLKLGVPSRSAVELWATTTTITAPGGGAVRVLSPAGALLLALTHLNKDGFALLGAYVEVARIAADPELELPAFHRLVATEGLEVVVERAAAAVAGVLPLPRSWRPPPIAGRLARARARLWDRTWPSRHRLAGERSRRSRLRQGLIPVMMTGRSADALREWKRLLLPPRDLLDVHAPELRAHGAVRRLTVDRARGRRPPRTR